MAGFFDNKVSLVTPVSTRPDYLGSGEFTVQIKAMTEIPMTAIKKVTGAAITVTMVKTSNPKFAVGKDFSLTFLDDKSYGFMRLKRFFKDVVGASDAELEVSQFYKDHFPANGEAPLIGMYLDIEGRDKPNKEKTATYTDFRFGAARLEA